MANKNKLHPKAPPRKPRKPGQKNKVEQAMARPPDAIEMPLIPVRAKPNQWQRSDGKAYDGMPANKFIPTEEQREAVRVMAACGVPRAEMVRVFGISVPTLEGAFKDELTNGSAQTNHQVRQTLFRLAISGECVAATIFWLKTRDLSRWHEAKIPGGPVDPATKTLIDMTRLSLEELREFQRILTVATGDDPAHDGGNRAGTVRQIAH